MIDSVTSPGQYFGIVHGQVVGGDKSGHGLFFGVELLQIYSHG